MATYTLSGSGTQALSADVTALYVSIITLPSGVSHGGASPADYYGIGTLRAGDATAFWDPFTISGGPQWLPCPFGASRLGYALATDAVINVQEVIGGTPPFGGGSGGSGGGGAATSWAPFESYTLPHNTTGFSFPLAGVIPTTGRHLKFIFQARGNSSSDTAAFIRFNGDSAANYVNIEHYAVSGSHGSGVSTAQTGARIGNLPGTTHPANEASAGEVMIFDYRNTSVFKRWSSIVSGWQSGAPSALQFAGRWASTAAITSISFYNSPNFAMHGLSNFQLYVMD